MKYLGRCFRYVPIALSIGGPITFFITYGIAVAKDHVTWFWPYISHTGAFPPESCIFSLLLNTFSFALIGVIYLKYRLVSELAKINNIVGIKRYWNFVAAVVGYVSCFGLLLVANFQETSNIIVHIIGAIIAFVFGVVYFFLQTVLTYRTKRNSNKLFAVRLGISISCLILMIGFLAPIAPAKANFKGKNHFKWTKEDGGFELHLVSTFFEWFLMFAVCSFFLSMFWDFRDVRIVPPQINVLDSTLGESKLTEI